MLTVLEVAERLGISDEGVKRLIKRGELVAYKVGGVYRIAEEDLARYLAQARTVKQQ